MPPNELIDVRKLILEGLMNIEERKMIKRRRTKLLCNDRDQWWEPQRSKKASAIRNTKQLIRPVNEIGIKKATNNETIPGEDNNNIQFQFSRLRR